MSSGPFVYTSYLFLGQLHFSVTYSLQLCVNLWSLLKMDLPLNPTVEHYQNCFVWKRMGIVSEFKSTSKFWLPLSTLPLPGSILSEPDDTFWALSQTGGGDERPLMVRRFANCFREVHGAQPMLTSAVQSWSGHLKWQLSFQGIKNKFFFKISYVSF